VLLCTALLLGGCASGRVSAPDLAATARPSGFERIRYPADGVSLAVPSNWTATAETAPLIAVYSSGPAVISLWRFASAAPAITSAARLRDALSALVRAAKAKDPSFTVQRSGLSRVAGAGAVIIDALERVSGKLRRVRTEHVYVAGAELVLDAYAPVDQFPSVDHDVFSPVRRSLALLDRGRPGPGATATSTATTETAPATTATAAPGTGGAP
jgi:hypothetical protein